MNWSEYFKQWSAEALAEAARREAEHSFCYGCMDPSVRVQVARARFKSQMSAGSAVGLTGPTSCSQCGAPRTFLPDASESATDGAARVDLPALRQAVATIEAHRDLIAASATDLGYPGERAVRVFVAAVSHVVDNGFRSAETRGGS